MIADNFGSTFLGKYWLSLLSFMNTDEETVNGGKALAEREAIKYMRFEKEKLYAEIDDDGAIYKTSISFNSFTSQIKNKLGNLIRQHKNTLPDIYFSIMPEEFFNEMLKNKIFLIPENRRSVKAECSCNNEGICSHISALIYSSAAEIEKNSSLLFLLRRFDVKKAFHSNADSGIIKYEKLSTFFSSYKNLNADDFPNTQSISSFHIEAVNILSIFKLLPEKPLFYTREDFRALLLEKYKALAGFADEYAINEKLIHQSLSGTEFFIAYYSAEEINNKNNNLNNGYKLKPVFLITKGIPEIKVIREDNVAVPQLSGKEVKLAEMTMFCVPFTEVIKYFLALPLNIEMRNNSVSSRFLNIASSLALMLVKNYAYIPEIRFITDEEFIVSYCPLAANDSIIKALAVLKEIAPPNLVIRKSDSAVYEKNVHIHILSIFITHIINLYEAKYGRKHYFSDQKIYNTFFKGETFHPEKYDEYQNGMQAALWLEKLSYINLSIRPVLIFRDIKEDEYEFNIVIRNNSDDKTYSLSELFESEQIESEALRSRIVRQLNSASELFPDLTVIISNQGKESGKLTACGMYDFLKKTGPVLSLLGIDSDIPQEMKIKNSPQAVLTARLKSFSGLKVNIDVSQLIEFEWKINVGDQLIPVDEYFKLVGQNEGLINIGGNYFINDQANNEYLQNQVKSNIKDGNTQNVLKFLLSGEFKGSKIVPEANINDILNSLFLVEEIELPQDLKTELRHYQISGFNWLYSKLKKGFGLCLADDMGLGKTVQVIAVLLKIKQENLFNLPVLIICPTSLVANWYKELERFAPSLKVFIYHGSRRRFELSKNDVLLTTYGIIRNETDKFKRFNWNLIILDEAQNIKNWESDQAKSVKLLDSQLHLALSGTPVENRLTELWSIFDFINKDYLGTYHHFRSNYAIPIEKYGDTDKLIKLRQITSPFLLRRLKSDPDVIDDLPDKIELDEYCYLTQEQKDLYKKTISDIFMKITHARKNERSGFILNLITYLKQICNHPAQFTKERNIDYRLSGKTEKMIDLVSGFLDRDEKVLIFTQYKEMGQILCMMLKYEFNIKPLFFHGSLTTKKRDLFIEQFQNHSESKIMIVSIKAGGTGLNLTAAERVLHFDLWWNPAVENQATDRTYRIGQDKKVTVHRLISADTFEEKIDKMLKQKKELADLAIVSGEPNFSELSNKELKQIFKLD